MIDQGLIITSDDEELRSTVARRYSEEPQSSIVTAPQPPPPPPPSQQQQPQIITKSSLHQLRIQLPTVLQIAQAATAEAYRDSANNGAAAAVYDTACIHQRQTSEQVRNSNSVTVVVIKTMLPE